MDDPGLFHGLVAFALLLVIGIRLLRITRNHREDLQLQVRLFVCAFILRFVMSIAIYEFGLVNILFDEDSQGWLYGVFLQQTWERQGIGLLELPAVLTGAFKGQHQGYFYLVGVFFYLTSLATRLSAGALNCFVGALTVVVSYRIARSLFSPWVAIRVGWWTCFFPSLIIWSAQTLKEPVVILLEILALYGCVGLKRFGFSPRHILLCALSSLLLIPFRFYAAFIVGAASLLALTLPQIGKGKFRFGSALGVVAIVVPIMVMGGLLAQYHESIAMFDSQYIQTARKNVATGAGSGSGVELGYDMQTSEGFRIGTLVGAVYLLLSPFPWQLFGGSLRKALTAPEMLVWWWLFFVGVLPGLWYAIRTRFNELQPLLFFMLGLGFLYSTTFGNVGLVFRQRAQLLPLLIMIAIVGLEQRALRRLAARRLHTGGNRVKSPAPEFGVRLSPMNPEESGRG